MEWTKWLEVLRAAKPNSWLAFSEDESRLVASGETYSQVVKEAEAAGEKEAVILKVPATWSSMAF